MSFKEYDSCRLCPRKCGAARNLGKRGLCNESSVLKIGRAALHMWEEPCISGSRGSGTVFFSGCSLKCCYCQNYSLSHTGQGEEIDTERLCGIFIELQEAGAHNINLVTAEHFAPHIKESVSKAKKRGLNIPIILNSSGYVSVNTLNMLKDTIDIFLVDFKYMDNSLSGQYSLSADYPTVAKKALHEMVSMAPKLVFDDDGILQKGVIVRHLCLPGHIQDSKDIISYIFGTYKNSVRLSIMSQYTPLNKSISFENLKRKLSQQEYDSVIDFCLNIGIEEAYVQDGDSASESFIPDFSLENKENIII